MVWFVSRQSYYYSRLSIVEITAGGIDYAGADMLCTEYESLGEGREFTDPREAVEAAIKIASAWRKDSSGKRIVIGHGSTGGMGMELEPCSIKEARRWAKEAYEKLEKCDFCNELLPDKEYQYTDEFGELKFCSERCVEKHLEEQEDMDREEEEENES